MYILQVRRLDKNDWDVPETWDTMGQHEIATIEVARDSKDFHLCHNVIFRCQTGCITTATHRIVRVQRVQNLPCLRAYAAERKNILRRRGAANLNEMYLVHGTNGLHPLGLAAKEEGFMVEHAKESGLFGKGPLQAHTNLRVLRLISLSA